MNFPQPQLLWGFHFFSVSRISPILAQFPSLSSSNIGCKGSLVTPFFSWGWHNPRCCGFHFMVCAEMVVDHATVASSLVVYLLSSCMHKLDRACQGPCPLEVSAWLSPRPSLALTHWTSYSISIFLNTINAQRVSSTLMKLFALSMNSCNVMGVFLASFVMNGFWSHTPPRSAIRVIFSSWSFVVMSSLLNLAR